MYVATSDTGLQDIVVIRDRIKELYEASPSMRLQLSEVVLDWAYRCALRQLSALDQVAFREADSHTPRDP